jgi:hypothetical protein
MGIAQFLRGILGPRRSRRPPEAFIVSYPKSGQMWLRLLLGKVLSDYYGVPAEHLLDTHRATCIAGVAATKFTHDGSGMREGCHFTQLNANKTKFAEKKVVLLVRDPRDVMVSCYFHATKRINVYNGSIADFVRSEHFGIRKCVTFYRQWGQSMKVPRESLCVRYEEIHAGPQRVLGSVLNFLGIKDVTPESLAAAVEFGRFENMKKMEASGQFKRQVLTPGDAKDGESFKVRRGKVGGITDVLGPSDCDYLTQVISEAQSPLLAPYLTGGAKRVA